MSLPAKEPPPVEDARSARPYLLRRSPLEAFARRTVSVLALVGLDVVGLTLGLYAALVLRYWYRYRPPILWTPLWDQETDWLLFLILVTILVFWRNGLYRPRELRGGIGRVVQSVALVTALALAFAIGTSQHFQTFGLYVVAPILIAACIALLRWSYETLTGSMLRSFGVRRRVLLVGDDGQVAHLRATLGASRGGIDYEFAGHVAAAAAPAALLDDRLDELIVADDGMAESELLELVELAHRRGVKVRVAPRTTQLLVERGEYVPGQSVVLFDVSPPILAGADWALKRGFDLLLAGLTVVVGLPLWIVIAAAIKLTSRGPVFYADERVGLGVQSFRMLKFRTMVADAAGRQAALEQANEASGALFKIRNDPRVTAVGRLPAALLDRRGAERDQRAARPDVARRPAAAAAPRQREARVLAPPPLERAAGHDGPLASVRPDRPELRRPRAARLLLPGELVALARHHDPREDGARSRLQARIVAGRTRGYRPLLAEPLSLEARLGGQASAAAVAPAEPTRPRERSPRCS